MSIFRRYGRRSIRICLRCEILGYEVDDQLSRISLARAGGKWVASYQQLDIGQNETCVKAGWEIRDSFQFSRETTKDEPIKNGYPKTRPRRKKPYGVIIFLCW